MKKLLLISSLFLAYMSSNAQGVWISQASGFNDVTSGVRNVVALDSNVVWITSYDGTGGNLPREDYSRTVDGGNHWVANFTPASTSFDWSMITAVSDSNAWAVYYNAVFIHSGQIWHTTDAGANWTQQGAGQMYTNTSESFPNVIHFWNDTDGVIIGDPVDSSYEIYTTTNGGTTWDSVPRANIPPPANSLEAGWTTHIDVIGDTVWFDTNEGRVYRSIDHGHNWTVSSTNLPIINNHGSIDVHFSDHLHGIARYYNDTTITNAVVESNDGGTTWNNISVSGNFYGADFQRVPGVDSMYVSTGFGSLSSFFGTSYSTDGGHSWITVDSLASRNILGVADSLHMWCGGFTTSPTSDGIFKWVSITPVSCSDTLITTGITSASDTALCGEDTLTVTATGVYSPVNGTYSGVSWVISTQDISGSPNPLLEPSFFTSYLITFPAPSVSQRLFINDATIIDGIVNPYGVYYWTPVVFGNAVAATSPVQYLQDLTLDNACTFTGSSIAVNILDPVNCSLSGIKTINANHLAVASSIQDRNTLNVLINSNESGKTSIELMDLTGRVLKYVSTFVSAGSNHEVIDISNLASGTYLIKAEVNGSRAVNKVVKY